MGRYSYRCTRCDKVTPRDQLTVKKVIFKEMGEQGRQVRSRNIAWLCKPCLREDETFQEPEFGILERVETEKIANA